MPVGVLATSVPAGEVHVVHATVVEGWSFRLVAFGRQEVRRQVCDVKDGQLPDLPRRDELAHRPVVPGVAVEEVNRDQAVARLDRAQQRFFVRDRRAERLLGRWMSCCSTTIIPACSP